MENPSAVELNLENTKDFPLAGLNAAAGESA
jgi:hypothetical protein